jgi:hypothetical protein
MSLCLLTLILGSNISSVTAINTHLDSITPITCEQGNSQKITAQLWIENYFWDNPLTGEELYFQLRGGKLDNALVYNKSKDTRWPDGKASLTIDTKDIRPGNYTLVISYFGNTELANYGPCSVSTKFNVLPSNKTL